MVVSKQNFEVLIIKKKNFCLKIYFIHLEKVFFYERLFVELIFLVYNFKISCIFY